MKEPKESEMRDALWDAFLEKNTYGQFQQSSKWAKVKALDGWNCHRMLFTSSGGGVEGGYQILWRRSKFLRIGYISKGPVLKEETDSTIQNAFASIYADCQKLRLNALILQPPDLSRIEPWRSKEAPFFSWPVPSIVDTTMVFDLADSPVEFELKMSRNIRREARHAKERHSLFLHIGERKDLNDFFNLMKASCRRQKTIPNPSRVDTLAAIWDNFSPKVRLTFAQMEGQKIAGLFQIGFGNRLTLWKKGWDGAAKHTNPNSFLNVELLNYAKSHEYRIVDFMAGDRSLADSIQTGIPLNQAQQKSRHIFHLRLGAKTQIIPSGHLLIVNPYLRFIMQKLACRDLPFRHLMQVIRRKFLLL